MKVKGTLTTFGKKQVKKWDQNVSKSQYFYL